MTRLIGEEHDESGAAPGLGSIPVTHDPISGPVAITGATGHVGRHLCARLEADHPNDVIALSRDDDWEAAINASEAVVHLAGTLQPKSPDTHEGSNLGSVRRTVDALADSPARRVVMVSYVGADPTSSNAYLRSKGSAEQLVRYARTPSVILRSTLIYGPPQDLGPSFEPYRVEDHGSVSVLGSGRQQVAPVFVENVVNTILDAALDPLAATGTFSVAGPETMTMDDVVRRVNEDGVVTIRHIPAWIGKAMSAFRPRLTPSLVDVITRDSVPQAGTKDAERVFGARRTRFGRLRRTADPPQDDEDPPPLT